MNPGISTGLAEKIDKVIYDIDRVIYSLEKIETYLNKNR